MAKGRRNSKNFTDNKFEAFRNEELYKAMMEIRRSNASSKHVSKKDKGTRKENKRNAIASFM